MAIFEGVVSLFERNGAVEIRRVSSGGYDSSEVKELVNDMLELKKPVSKWSLWIDGIEHKQADTYSASTLAKIIKGNSVELIAAKRKRRDGGKFMAPVLKITSPNSAPKAAPNKARLGR